MQATSPKTESSGFNLNDAYYTFFRHKWKIAICTVLGVAAASWIFFMRQPLYQSEARVLIRYVRDSKSIDTASGAGQVQTPDARGDNILNNEIEILTSLDLATQVAETVGPEKVLARLGGGTNLVAAAVAIAKGVEVDVPRRSNVLRVALRHPDREIALAVLKQLIESYKRKHAEVHRALGVTDDFLTRQTDNSRTRLNQIEADLSKLKAQAGVFSVTDTEKMITEQRSRISQDLFNAEAELAERRTALETVQQAAGLPATTNASLTTTEAALDPELVSRYRAVCTRLASFRNLELDRLGQYSDDSTPVKQVRIQIAETEKLKTQLESEHPKLTAVQPILGPRNPQQPIFDVVTETARVIALEAKIRVLTNNLATVKAAAAALDASGTQIATLERQKEIEEANYRSFSINLEQARIDEALGAGNLPNISVVQEPTPPFIDAKGKLKQVGMALGGGLGAGLGLALLLEFFLDRTIRKPSQVESILRLPLFLTVPVLARNGHGALSKPSKALPPACTTEQGKPDGKALAIATTVDTLALYFEALRDRLILYFQMNGLTHRPKLVGVTSCSRGSGVTTFAAGLAASLSETGEGNVLFVDMNVRNGAGVHPFYRGKAICNLSEALEQDKRSTALVQENLYVVTAQSGNGEKVGLLPRKFANIVPKLQATDYDYIIFDLPPVNQTSPTSKLAGLLDMTLLIFESEKSQQDAANRALALLAESKAKVAAVLNKHKPYVPPRFQVEC